MIIHADDEERDRREVYEVLTQAGYQVLSCESLGQVCSLANGSDITLIILDGFEGKGIELATNLDRQGKKVLIYSSATVVGKLNVPLAPKGDTNNLLRSVSKLVPAPVTV